MSKMCKALTVLETNHSDKFCLTLILQPNHAGSEKWVCQALGVP